MKLIHLLLLLVVFIPLAEFISVPSSSLVSTKKIRGGGKTSKKLPARQELGEGTSTIPNQVFNLVKSIVGAGVLGLPAGIAAMSNAPSAVVPASFLVIAIGMLSCYGFLLIGRVCAYTSSKTYREAWSKSVSDKTSWMPATACLLVTSCTVLACSMILSDILPQLSKAFFQVDISRTQALLGVTCFILLPLCLLKSMEKLAPFSLLGIFGMLYTATVMAMRYFQGSYAEGGAFYDVVDPKPSFGSSLEMSSSAFILVSMLASSYMAHYNAAKFYYELRDNTLPRYFQVVTTSFGISIGIFVAVATFGFLTFGESCKGLVLHNYATQDSLMSLARIAVALSIICSYPLAFVGVRDGVLNLLKIENVSSQKLDALTIVLLAIVTMLAYFVQDLRIVLSLGGATWGNAVVYLFPTYMFCSYAKTCGEFKKEVPWARATGITGLIMAIIGTSRALKSIKTP